MSPFCPGDTQFRDVMVGGVDAPEKHESVLDAVQPISDKLLGEYTYERSNHQPDSGFRFEAKREPGGITERGEEIRDRCVIGFIVDRNPD